MEVPVRVHSDPEPSEGLRGPSVLVGDGPVGVVREI